MSRELSQGLIDEIASGREEAAGTWETNRFVKRDLDFRHRLTAMSGNQFLIHSLEAICDVVDWGGTEP